MKQINASNFCYYLGSALSASHILLSRWHSTTYTVPWRFWSSVPSALAGNILGCSSPPPPIFKIAVTEPKSYNFCKAVDSASFSEKEVLNTSLTVTRTALLKAAVSWWKNSILGGLVVLGKEKGKLRSLESWWRGDKNWKHSLSGWCWQQQMLGVGVWNAKSWLGSGRIC